MVTRVRGRLLSGYRQAGAAWGIMTSVLADTIPGIRVVKAFAQEGREIERFDASNERVFHSANRLNKVWSLFGPTVTLLTTGGLLDRLGLRHLAKCLRRTHGRRPDRVSGLHRSFLRAHGVDDPHGLGGAACVGERQRIFEILDKHSNVPEPARPVHPGRLKGRIELRGVRFKYGRARCCTVWI